MTIIINPDPANRERSGSVVECLTLDRGAAGSSLNSIISVVSLSKNINPSLVLVQPRKTHPFITERLLMGRKESNQTNKKNDPAKIFCPENICLLKLLRLLLRPNKQFLCLG